MFAHSLASMGRFGGVTDFLPSLFIRVPELCPAARFFSSLHHSVIGTTSVFCRQPIAISASPGMVDHPDLNKEQVYL
jgi:hypothetical protein